MNALCYEDVSCSVQSWIVEREISSLLFMIQYSPLVRADRALGYRSLCSDKLQGSSWPLLHLMQNVVWATRNDAVHLMLFSHAQLMP